MSKYGVLCGSNAGKYGPEITPYLGTFHAVRAIAKLTLPWYSGTYQILNPFKMIKKIQVCEG